MSIIHIKGIPGSGKTWICQQLTGIACYDLDDIFTESYRELQSQGLPVARINIGARAKRKVVALVAQHRAAGTPAVFVGITVEVSKADHRYFIKMTPEELKTAYRRVLRRELDKIVNCADTIRGIIAQESVERVSLVMQSEYHIEAVELTMPFSDYKKMYHDAVRFEKKNGLTILPQADILRAILSD